MTFQTLFAASYHIYLGNAIWYLIVFALLLLLVKHYAWGPVSKMMEKKAAEGHWRFRFSCKQSQKSRNFG